MFLGLIPSVKFIMKPQQTFNPHRKAAKAASRKSEKYSNSRRGLSGRLKCKFVHKSLSASASSRHWVRAALPVLCPKKVLRRRRSSRAQAASSGTLHTPLDGGRVCVRSVCVCVWRGNPSLSLNEMKTEATHTRTHTYEHAQTCFSGL